MAKALSLLTVLSAYLTTFNLYRNIHDRTRRTRQVQNENEPTTYNHEVQ
jgi:hypothetical protein